MKENKELERNDIAIDRDMEVDYDIGQEIMVYIETWFDVDKKFHIETASDDDTWLNMYGRYNPFDDSLRIECEISRQDGSTYFDYEPTKDEAQLIKDMIAEKIQEDYHQTPQEFCEDYYGLKAIGGEYEEDTDYVSVPSAQVSFIDEKGSRITLHFSLDPWMKACWWS